MKNIDTLNAFDGNEVFRYIISTLFVSCFKEKQIPLRSSLMKTIETRIFNDAHEESEAGKNLHSCESSGRTD